MNASQADDTGAFAGKREGDTGGTMPGSDDPLSTTPGSVPGIHVELRLDVDEPDPPLTGWLEPLVKRAADACGAGDGEINIVLVDDDAMSQLHEQYRRESGTTDVLTFDLSIGGAELESSRLEGDLVICLDEATRQAAQRDIPLRYEVLLYATHGLLHLLGEDDTDEAAATRMHQREDELLQALGIGPVYEPPARHGDKLP